MRFSRYPLTAVTSLLAAHFADKYGRRVTMRIGAVFFSIGGVIQTFCVGYRSMVVGRFISGCGVGMLRWVLILSLLTPAWLFQCIKQRSRRPNT